MYRARAKRTVFELTDKREMRSSPYNSVNRKLLRQINRETQVPARRPIDILCFIRDNTLHFSALALHREIKANYLQRMHIAHSIHRINQSVYPGLRECGKLFGSERWRKITI